MFIIWQMLSMNYSILRKQSWLCLSSWLCWVTRGDFNYHIRVSLMWSWLQWKFLTRTIKTYFRNKKFKATMVLLLFFEPISHWSIQIWHQFCIHAIFKGGINIVMNVGILLGIFHEIRVWPEVDIGGMEGCLWQRQDWQEGMNNFGNSVPTLIWKENTVVGRPKQLLFLNVPLPARLGDPSKCPDPSPIDKPKLSKNTPQCM